MDRNRVFLYAEYQVSIPFDHVDWRAVNPQMQKFPGLRSKTWLSGVNTGTVGGFYEFDTIDNARRYVDEMLLPFARQVGGSLTVKLFDGDVTAAASAGMGSPFYTP